MRCDWRTLCSLKLKNDRCAFHSFWFILESKTQILTDVFLEHHIRMKRERERPDIKLGAFQLRSQNLGDGWALLDQASPFKDVTGIQRIWGHISQREGLLYFH